VRTQGGNNAGHTVYIGSQKYVLHLIPSGILRPEKQCVIGNGVVVDPISLVEEIDGLAKLGITVDANLFVSETAHLVFPYHRELDVQREILKGRTRSARPSVGSVPPTATRLRGRAFGSSIWCIRLGSKHWSKPRSKRITRFSKLSAQNLFPSKKCTKHIGPLEIA
jgi:hypothetical protein